MGTIKGAEAHENQGKLVTAVFRVVVFQEQLIKIRECEPAIRKHQGRLEHGSRKMTWGVHSWISWIYREWLLVNFSPVLVLIIFNVSQWILLVLLFG